MKIDDYRNLKMKYFDLLLSRKFVSRGDIRAYVGLKTWFHEYSMADSGDKSTFLHVIAFDEALRDFDQASSKDSIMSEIKRYQKIWIESGRVLERRPTRKPLLPPPIPKIKHWKKNGFNVVSLFTGAMGLDLGFIAAGFDICFATDIDAHSKKTLDTNLPEVPFVLADFSNVTSDRIMNESGLDKGEIDVLTGGPPCQPFSTAGKRKGLSDPRASPLREFVRTVKDLQPKIFVIEEVTGILSSRIKHVPISERRGQALLPNEKKGSVFKVVLDMLYSTGYKINFEVLNAADYGSPQVRNRLIIIGTKEEKLTMPERTHTNSYQSNLAKIEHDPWNTLWECTTDLHGAEQTSTTISPSRAKYMIMVPPGGHWRHIPVEQQETAMGGAYFSGGGKMGFYRRLSWDEPSPTVVTSPVQKGSMFIHPESLRPLSVEEYKRIQGFPDDWKIPGSVINKYRLIGNAVPIHLSYAIAKHLASGL